jgi:hypothetical protein
MQSFLQIVKEMLQNHYSLALGACIIQAEYGYSDEETALQIQEAAYLQYFCGYSEYNDEVLPFDPSLMVYFRKRLTTEILGEINEMVITKANSEINDTDDKSEPHDAQWWVKENGISDGTRPNEPVTRAEVWQMLYRLKK